MRAHVKARELGLKLIIGSQVTVHDGSVIVLLVQDRGGYANLCRLLTKGRLRSEKGESAVTWEEVCTHAPGLIALWNSTNASVMPAKADIQTNGNVGKKQNLDSRLRGNDGIGSRLRADGELVDDATISDQIAGNLRDAFAGRIYALIARHRREEEIIQEKRLRKRAQRYGFALVAANEVLYHSPARRPLQDVLTAFATEFPSPPAAGSLSLMLSMRLSRPISSRGFSAMIRPLSSAHKKSRIAAHSLSMRSVIATHRSSCPTAQPLHNGCVKSRLGEGGGGTASRFLKQSSLN